MKRRDLVGRLERGGFRRTGGAKHDVYSNGRISVTVPRHSEINEHTARAILRQAGLA